MNKSIAVSISILNLDSKESLDWDEDDEKNYDPD
jgi:hypothetical protein